MRVFKGEAETYEFTSQFFFDDAFTDEVYKLTPYTAKGDRDTLNSTDLIYRGGSSTGTAITSNSGSHLMLALRNKQDWVETDATLICDLSLGSSPDQVPGAGGPGGPPPGTAPGPRP